MTYSKMESLFLTPKKTISTWKVTFKGYIMLNNKNVFVWCTFVLITIILSVIYCVQHSNYFIVLFQIMITVALLSIFNAKKAGEIIKKTITLVFAVLYNIE